MAKYWCDGIFIVLSRNLSFILERVENFKCRWCLVQSVMDFGYEAKSIQSNLQVMEIVHWVWIYFDFVVYTGDL